MKRRVLFWTSAVAITGAALIYGLRPKPVEVDLGRVTSGPFIVTVNESGEARVRELYAISAPLAGRLERIELETGDLVVKDQVLAEIVPVEPSLLDVRTEAELMARVNAAEAALHRAGNQHEIAKAESEKALRYRDRDRLRLEQGAISPPLLEDAEHALKVAMANLASAAASVEVAGFEREQAHAALLFSKSATGQTPADDRRFAIRSPIDGVVLRRDRESSAVLAGGESILELGDPRSLEVRIDVLSQDAVRIRPGQHINIEHWGGNADLTATVRRVDPAAFTKVSALGVDEQRVWIYADFTVPEPSEKPPLSAPGEFTDQNRDQSGSGLGDAYRIEGRIVIYERELATQVPAGALFRDGNEEGSGWAVFRVDEHHRAEKTIITPGERNDVAVEVMAGLQPGDRVVLHPGDKIRPGSLVKERVK